MTSFVWHLYPAALHLYFNASTIFMLHLHKFIMYTSVFSSVSDSVQNSNVFCFFVFLFCFMKYESCTFVIRIQLRLSILHYCRWQTVIWLWIEAFGTGKSYGVQLKCETSAIKIQIVIVIALFRTGRFDSMERSWSNSYSCKHLNSSLRRDYKLY